jgi:hypothetical protein
MRKFFAAAVVSAVALVGFAGTASANATVDLIWATNGTSSIGPGVVDSSAEVLRVILTADERGSTGAGVSVDYSQVAGLTVVSFLSTPSFPALPASLGTTTDTGSRVDNVNSAASIFLGFGTGLTAAGQSHQLGTITFHKSVDVGNGTFEITVDVGGPTDNVLDLEGNVISPTTDFNSAFLINVPEPGAIAMLVMGLGGVLLAGRGRRS